MAAQPTRPANRAELLQVILDAEYALREMSSRWHDSIPAPVRLELIHIADPLLDIALREPLSRRRG